MQKTSLEEIEKRANFYHENNLNWHFHILTPGCMLNNQNSYTFILECPDNREKFVYYSDRKEIALDKKLVGLLHGNDVLDKSTVSEAYKPSLVIKNIVDRAKELNRKGIEWHHHMLFPSCNFNKKSPKWVLMLEDRELDKVFESVTDEEPVNDLKQIEHLF